MKRPLASTFKYIGDKEFEGRISISVDAGAAPDIADFPQPGLLASFVGRQGRGPDDVHPEDWLAQQYNQSWLDMAQIETAITPVCGTASTARAWCGTRRPPLKRPAIPPDDLGRTDGADDQIIADGDAPWCVGIELGAATGWPATDWMEEFMLRTTSLENYDKWVTGELPFTSPEVKNAAETLGELWFTETRCTVASRGDRLDLLRRRPGADVRESAQCWLHKQGNFITSFFPEGAKAGVDYGFFYLPGIDEQYGKPFLVAGDIMAMFNDRPEVRALMEYFTAPQSASGWLETGGALAAHQTPRWNVRCGSGARHCCAGG